MKFDPDKLLELLQKLLESAGIHPPLWLTRGTTWAILLGVLLCAVWGLLFVLSKIKGLAAEFVPPRFNRETRRRLARRRRFAEHIENEIRRLNSEQSWSDYRFAELEAEVEAEGRRRASPFIPLLIPRTTSGLRREKSLTKAIDVSKERLILIEGEPGSGKSVALRHLAMRIAGRARRRGPHAVIPLYINMKQLDRSPEQAVDRKLIEEFVLLSLNRVNDRDVEEFLEEEFGKGLEEGTWLFLFDSFDEIPEILGSTEPDTIIRTYTRAIEDFLHGMNLCRGVVASRNFRGPGQVQWPRFRILPLSPERRKELVRRTDLPQTQERELLGRFQIISEQLGDQAKNPLFLSLICEHMKGGRPFPENGHAVFESYIEQRLTRDSDRINRRYGLKLTTVRKIAEQVSFCMAADPRLGLSPARERIPDAMARQGFESHSVLTTCLDALEFIKLARAESGTSGPERLFTFAHRRFQEYFATCLVLSSPERVSPRSLLLDGRWRETAVVICQTAQPAAFAPLLREAQQFLGGLTPPTLLGDFLQVREFPWPPGVLHVLGLLQDGFSGRTDYLPNELRSLASRWAYTATQKGTLSDRKWTLEVCGASKETTFIKILREAFGGESRWLAEAAYRQVARLRRIPQDVHRAVLAEMTRLYLRGGFWRSRHATIAHLNRMDKPERFLPSYKLLLWLPIIDGFLHIALLAALSTWHSGVRETATALFTLYLSWTSFRFLTSLSRFAIESSLNIPASAPSLLIVPPVRFLLFTIPYFVYAHPRELPMLLIFLSLAALSWAPSALFAAEHGQFTQLAWWPTLMITIPIWLFGRLRNARVTLKSLKTFFRISRESVKHLPYALALATVGPFILSFMIIRDAAIWAGKGTPKRPISFNDFIDRLQLFRLPYFRSSFIRSVRTHMLLDDSRETEIMIAHLAIDVEQWLRQDSKESSGWNHEALDELGRLREALRTEAITSAPIRNGALET